MNEVLQQGLSAEDIEHIRAEAAEAVKSYASQAAAAADAGIAKQTFSAFMAGTYAGNNERVARDVRRWLDARTERAQTAMALPTKPNFLVTPTADRIMSILQFSQIAGDLSVIAGGAGIGKTCTIRAYAKTHPNVWVATACPSSATVNGCLRGICEAMGVEEKSQSELSRAISRRLAGAGSPLLILDEAQHLSVSALEELRSIHDSSGSGLVLVGNESVYARLEGNRKAHFAQLFSRVGMKLPHQPKPRAGDVDVLLDAWGVAETAERKWCHQVAVKPGALRGLTKMLVLAGMLAHGSGAPRDISHMKAAWGRLSDEPTM